MLASRIASCQDTCTYVGKEYARNTTTGVLTLCVALSGIVTTRQTSLMASHRVLVSLNAAIFRVTIGSKASVVVLQETSNLDTLAIPAERKVGGRHDLDEVHKVEVGVVDLLARVVEGVLVVVGPKRALGANLLGNVVGQLRSEAERVDIVSEVVRLALRDIPVVLQVVDVHVTAAKASAGSKVEVTNDLVHTQTTLDTASLLALGIQLLAIVFSLALLNTLATAKGPRGLRIGFTDFVASLAAPSLSSIGRRLSAVTATTV
jgi:hypothetical protein